MDIPRLGTSSKLMMWFRQIFSWWNGQTIGTRFWTFKRGQLVGEDSQGNKYYSDRKDSKRRWVIYNGLAEASRVPPEWHGWLHKTVDVAPADAGYTPREWEKPHQPNLTGSQQAYRPAGSLITGAPRAKTAGDYEAWKPE